MDGSVYSTPGDIVNAFAHFFHSVFQVSGNHSSFEAALDSSFFIPPLVTEFDVFKSIKNIKPKSQQAQTIYLPTFTKVLMNF